MAAFAPGPAVLAALQMVQGVAGAGLPAAHVGLHAGPVLFQEGDYYGRTVNVAARIADYARPGEVLVTQEVVDASRSARLGRCHPWMHVAHVARRRARGIRRIVDDGHFSWKG